MCPIQIPSRVGGRGREPHERHGSAALTQKASALADKTNTGTEHPCAVPDVFIVLAISDVGNVDDVNFGYNYVRSPVGIFRGPAVKLIRHGARASSIVSE
jgi:hypothetical protein